ncbi:hypothetical protein BT69DRAFT_1159059 [Atractiella rhizophila]|nr:hypothetical protein BT69DRAFT_1159059 [Atractiella rhizophila]
MAESRWGIYVLPSYPHHDGGVGIPPAGIPSGNTYGSNVPSTLGAVAATNQTFSTPHLPPTSDLSSHNSASWPLPQPTPSGIYGLGQHVDHSYPYHDGGVGIPPPSGNTYGSNVPSTLGAVAATNQTFSTPHLPPTSDLSSHNSASWPLPQPTPSGIYGLGQHVDHSYPHHDGGVGIPPAGTPSGNTCSNANMALTNAHKQRKCRVTTTIQRKKLMPEEQLEIKRLKHDYTLYFDKAAKKIWMEQELFERHRGTEGLDGPITIGPHTSSDYVEVSCDGKECLPSASSQTDRNNFIRGQFKSVGGCSHGRGFQFRGKRPAAIADHFTNSRGSCPLLGSHPDLCKFVQWCYEMSKKKNY